jgi:predicted anti-sigma-YlaC factor YlaD
MNEQHIIEILDTTPFAALGESELSAIGAHTAGCKKCRDAFQAARGAAVLLKAEAERFSEPTPFFQTKVMAALREQRNNLRPIWDLRRLWQATGSLVSLMVMVVAGLIFAVELAPVTRGDIQALAAADSAEAVILEPDATLKDIASEQIFQEIYEK